VAYASSSNKDMGSLIIILAIVAVAFGIKIENCELAKELYTTHGIPQEEIYKHLCITEENITGGLGIYGIQKGFWCGENESSGGCSIKCDKLKDNNITDDVKCAKLIMAQQGLGAWRLNDDNCNYKLGYKTIANICLKDILPTTAMERFFKKLTRYRAFVDEYLKVIGTPILKPSTLLVLLTAIVIYASIFIVYDKKPTYKNKAF